MKQLRKGQRQEINLSFVSGPNGHAWKRYIILLNIRGVFHICKRLPGVFTARFGNFFKHESQVII
jgi:hypothetical protein